MSLSVVLCPCVWMMGVAVSLCGWWASPNFAMGGGGWGRVEEGRGGVNCYMDGLFLTKYWWGGGGGGVGTSVRNMKRYIDDLFLTKFCRGRWQGCLGGGGGGGEGE